jgi:hypothetical protein
MKLDTDPFPVGMVNLEEKKILVWSDQASTTKGNNVIVSDNLRNKMIKHHTPNPADGRRIPREDRCRGLSLHPAC